MHRLRELTPATATLQRPRHDLIQTESKQTSSKTSSQKRKVAPALARAFQGATGRRATPEMRRRLQTLYSGERRLFQGKYGTCTVQML